MKYTHIIFVSFLCLLTGLFMGCDSGGGSSSTSPATGFILVSPAWTSGAAIPVQYTCDGANISPPLQWSGAPEGTQSFVLIMDDPDAPGGTFTHWLLYNMPSTTTALAEGVSPGGALPAGSVEGTNDLGNLGYSGPCPPAGSTHRYFFRLYALDSALTLNAKATTAITLSAGVTRIDVDQGMHGKVIAQTTYMGTFAR